jgi:DNA-binding response OmpR family regulator
MKPVVIIDDDPDIREIFQYALEEEGFEVQSFSNGKKALEVLSKTNETPGLIIIDYLMPEMDGVTFIKELKEKFPSTLGMVPLAISSAMGSLSDKLSNVENLSYITKPIDLMDLLKLVKFHCA